MSRASPRPRSGDRSNTVMVGIIGRVMVIYLEETLTENPWRIE
jgi:hypothetical protein